MPEKQKQTYDSSNIQVLEGLEAVRERPGMYIGTTSVRGLHHLVWEIVDNSVDEYLAGYCDEINVNIHSDNSITVSDNGRGIPVDNHPKFGIPTVEVVLTVLHAGGKFGGGGYKVSGGLHGVGASVVNALSNELTVQVRREGKLHEISFSKGKTVEPLKLVEAYDGNAVINDGTTVHFVPDNTIFKDTTVYDFNTICSRMRESAFLNPGLKIVVIDERHIDPETKEFIKEEFSYEGGLSSYVEYLNQKKELLHDEILYITEMVDDVEVSVALQYTNTYGNDSTYSYANNVKTPGGGSHETGFKTALTNVIKKYIQDNNLIGKGKQLPSGEDMRVGLTTVISVKVPEPQFEGQTKDKLGNSEIAPIVSAVVSKHLEKFLMEKPHHATKIIKKIIDSFEERMAARKARQEKRAKKSKSLSYLDLSGKLADCSMSTPIQEREVFLVEGDSAGGSAKQGRIRATQAILPLRGKVLNVEKASSEKIFANEEIELMGRVFGTDMGDYYDHSGLRYQKVIIMTDADVDGSHIRILLLTFFYRYMRQLIERGHVFLAQPPLFAFKKGDRILDYCYTEEEKRELMIKYPNANIQRYKGLGEMNSTQLGETTMHPSTRKLTQVTIDDAIEAEKLVYLFMGDDSSLRKTYIQENSHLANLDF